jgi:hypothetical protein
VTRSLRLERVAAGVTERRLSGATVASGSQTGQAWKVNFGSLPNCVLAEDAGVGIRKRGVSFHVEHSADVWKRL